MATQVIKQSTNYSVSTSNDTFKLEGSFNVKDNNRIEGYNASVYVILDSDSAFVGNAYYNEYENSNVNYQYNCTSNYKADVIALVDSSIADIKNELVNE